MREIVRKQEHMLFLLFLLLQAVEAEEVWEEPTPSHCIRQNELI